MKIEYGWYPKHNIWAVFAVNEEGITKEFEYAGNRDTLEFLVKKYCEKYKTRDIRKIDLPEEEKDIWQQNI